MRITINTPTARPAYACESPEAYRWRDDLSHELDRVKFFLFGWIIRPALWVLGRLTGGPVLEIDIEFIPGADSRGGRVKGAVEVAINGIRNINDN